MMASEAAPLAYACFLTNRSLNISSCSSHICFLWAILDDGFGIGICGQDNPGSDAHQKGFRVMSGGR